MMGWERVACDGAELCPEAVVEHVADHGHTGRPLRHSAELSMTELRHGSTAAARRIENRLDCIFGHALFACQSGQQFQLLSVFSS